MALELSPSQANGEFPDSVLITGTRKEIRRLIAYLRRRVRDGGKGYEDVLRSTGRDLWEVYVTVTDEE